MSSTSCLKVRKKAVVESPSTMESTGQLKVTRSPQQLESVKSAIRASKDPLRESHYFVLAKPVTEIQKKSTNRKIAPDGIVAEPVLYEERESRVFRRLGIDLVEVTDGGDAVVHIRPERLEQLFVDNGGFSTSSGHVSRLDGQLLIRLIWSRHRCELTSLGFVHYETTHPRKRLLSFSRS
jgi:hypothetical protein